MRALLLIVALGLAAAIASCATSSDGDDPAGAGPATGAGAGAEGGSSASQMNRGGGDTVGGFGGAGGGASTCGNGEIEPPETCDGANLNGKTCIDFGLSPGNLQCNASCQIVVSACGIPESCTNGVDDDGNGAIDCLDSACLSEPACLDSCAEPLTVVLPTIDLKSTLGRPDTYAPSCATTSGSEFVYAVTPANDGMLGVRIGQQSGDFTVAVMTGCGVMASEIGCAGVTENRYFTESLRVWVTANTTYFVIVDAASPTDSGEFDVQLFMVSGPEATCFDLVDGDADGLIDCADPDCQSSNLCTAGTNALGAPCGHSGHCSAADDDPVCLPSPYGFSGGYCSEFCDMGATDCPGDGVCFDYGVGTVGVCLDGCTTSAQCRSGYACVDLGLASRVCYIAPESNCGNYQDDDGDLLTDCDDPDCRATQACAPGTGDYGDACTANNQCASANGDDPLCFRSPPFFVQSGYCSEFCNVGTSDCGANGVCHDWFFLDGTTGQCFRRCQTSGDCASGTSCVDHGFGKHCNF